VLWCRALLRASRSSCWHCCCCGFVFSVVAVTAVAVAVVTVVVIAVAVAVAVAVVAAAVLVAAAVCCFTITGVRICRLGRSIGSRRRVDVACTADFRLGVRLEKQAGFLLVGLVAGPEGCL
jgi:hypothetical protein